MDNLPRYKKIEIALFGVIAPMALTAYTVYLLLKYEAVFWVRSTSIIYYGSDAILVSLLWFAISLMMLSCFFLRPLNFIGYVRHKLVLYISVTLISVGLISVVVLI